MAKDSITQTTPHNTPGILVSEAKDLDEIQKGLLLTGGGANTDGIWVVSLSLRLRISKITRPVHILSIFLYMLPVAVARSSPTSVRYVM